jgi:DNA-binding transcriptional ArsR family regulator
MGASKTQQYSADELNRALKARALAHPARIRIYELLKEESVCKNKDLSKKLGLSVSSVHDHLQKMIEADIIHIEFKQNSNFLQIKDDNKSQLGV